MDEPTRSVWNKPELVVIARGNPEETLLLACKANGGADGPFVGVDACSGCSPCNQVVDS